MGALSNLGHDLRCAARRLRASLGFTGAAVITIALGVGVNTGIFSALNGVALRELPAPDADELVSIHQIFDEATTRQRFRSGPASNFSTSEYRTYRDSTQTSPSGYNVLRSRKLAEDLCHLSDSSHSSGSKFLARVSSAAASSRRSTSK